MEMWLSEGGGLASGRSSGVGGWDGGVVGAVLYSQWYPRL